jgi:hypothetical protein
METETASLWSKSVDMAEQLVYGIQSPVERGSASYQLWSVLRIVQNTDLIVDEKG